MKTVNLICFFLLLIPRINAQEPAYKPAPGNWKVSFSDEFNQQGLDFDRWNVEDGTYNTQGDSRRDSGNVQVEDGELRIYMLKKTDETAPKQRWTCGYIYTKEMFGRNVYIEARMKAVKASGVNSAFWTVSRDKMATSFSDRYEIDINEIQYDTNRQQFASRLGWHDWKTYGYATDSNGKQVDNGLGSMHYYSEDDYQIWGLWLDGNQLHFYLNGVEIWTGKEHSIYTKQWDTGVGQISPWATDEEQRAYGKYDQSDWNYMGGYTGELMHIAFSTMLMPFAWSPETDEADGQYMAVDWVRCFVPEKELNRTPTSLSNSNIHLKKGSHKIALDEPIYLNVANNYYLSYWVNNPHKSNYRVNLLDDANQVVSSFAFDPASDYTLSFGNRQTNSGSVYPYSFYLQPEPTDNRLFVTRITALPNTSADAVSVKFYNENERVESLEPFFYSNISKTGQTAINNQWSLNVKSVSSARVIAIEFENLSDGEIEILGLRRGNSYLSVVAKEEELPFAHTQDIILRSEKSEETILINIESETPATLLLSKNSDDHEALSWQGGNSVLSHSVSADKTTTYQLISIENDKGKKVLGGKAVVFVPAKKDLILYPSFDTYIQENQPLKDFSTSQNLVLKTDRGYNRLGYLEFDVPQSINDNEHTYMFLSLKEITAPLFPVEVTLTTVETPFTQPLYWAGRQYWKDETEIGKIQIYNNDLRQYGFDITEALRKAISEGKDKLSICLSLTGGERSSVVTFQQYISSKKETSPRIYIQQLVHSSIKEDVHTSRVYVYPNPVQTYFSIKGNHDRVQVMNLFGDILLDKNTSDQYDVGRFAPGIYLVRIFDEFNNETVQKLLIK